MLNIKQWHVIFIWSRPTISNDDIENKPKIAHVILWKNAKITVKDIFSCPKIKVSKKTHPSLQASASYSFVDRPLLLFCSLKIGGDSNSLNKTKNDYFIVKNTKIIKLRFQDRLEFDSDLSTKLIS